MLIPLIFNILFIWPLHAETLVVADDKLPIDNCVAALTKQQSATSTLPSICRLKNADKVEPYFAQTSYYVKKHILPASFIATIEDLNSGELERMQKAQQVMHALETAITLYPHNSYQRLPETIDKNHLSPQTWDHFRFRYPADKSGITYFHNEQHLTEVLETFKKMWIEKSNNLVIYKSTRPNGVASLNFDKDGVKYSIAICMKESPQCDKVGLVKSIFPICGPGIETLDLKQFRLALTTIHVRASSRAQLGFRPTVCP